MEVHERIKQRRVALGLSADDLADALNISRATVYRYESAAIEKLPTSILGPLSKALHCSPAYLMGWEEELFPKKEQEEHERQNRLSAYADALDKLNEQGKEEALKRIEELAELSKYRKAI